jgi:flagellar biosynthesis GTPase FlhF
MLSLSVRLGNKAMGYVAAGLVTAATVAAAIGAAVSGETFDGFNSDGYSSSVNTDSEGRYSVQDLLRKTQSEANSLRARYESEKNAVETEISTSNYSQASKSRSQNISIMAGELKQKNLIISRLQRKQENGINYITPEEWDAIVEQAHDSERETKKLNDARRNLQKEEKESKRLRNALDKNTKAINELNRKLQ